MSSLLCVFLLAISWDIMSGFEVMEVGRGGFGLQRGLNGVYCQPSNGLKFNCQRSKKVIFTVNREKCRLMLIVKKFQGISNLSISANLSRSWRLISKLEKPFLDITRASLEFCLYLKIFQNFLTKRLRKPPKHNS